MAEKRYRPLTIADVMEQECDTCPVLGSVESQTWLRAAMNRYGLCGVGEFHCNDLTACLVVAPAQHLPQTHPLAGLSDDGAQTAVLMLAHPWDGMGTAHSKQLVVSLVTQLALREVHCLEAVAGGGVSLHRVSCCRPPMSWLAGTGFHPIGPVRDNRYRLDIGSTATWLKELDAVWERLRNLVAKPIAPPEPSRRSHPSIRRNPNQHRLS